MIVLQGVLKGVEIDRPEIEPTEDKKVENAFQLFFLREENQKISSKNVLESAAEKFCQNEPINKDKFMAKILKYAEDNSLR